MATAVIDQAAYIPEQDVSKLFLKESMSTIWAFQPNPPGYNTEEAFTYILNGSPGSSRPAMSSSQINAFESADTRAVEWVGAVSEGSDTWYFPYKYKAPSNDQGIDYEYPVILRIEEQYLIRAEARAHLNKFEEAREDLDVLRGRAGVGNSTAANLEDLLQAVLKERQLELFVVSSTPVL